MHHFVLFGRALLEITTHIYDWLRVISIVAPWLRIVLQDCIFSHRSRITILLSHGSREYSSALPQKTAYATMEKGYHQQAISIFNS